MRYKIHFKHIPVRPLHDGSSKWQDTKERVTQSIDTLTERTISIRLVSRHAITKPISRYCPEYRENEISLAFHDTWHCSDLSLFPLSSKFYKGCR